MSTWVDTTLGEVLTLQRGFDLAARFRVPGPYPIISSSGTTGYHSKYKAEGPGVVIGRYGSLGSVHWVDGPYWPLNTSLWVKDFKGNDPRFISYLLSTVKTDGSAASAVPGVNRNHLHRQQVRLAPLSTQRRIAAVLSALDELIEINERRIALLEDLARSLYREWFVHFRFPGHENATFVDSELGPIPDGWVPLAASDILQINPKRPGKQASFRKFGMSALNEKRSYAFSDQTVSKAAGTRFQNGDVLMARITPCLENGKTGLIAGLSDAEIAVGSTEFIVLTGKTVGPAFVYCFARSERVRGHAIQSMSGATGRQRVRNECFDTLMVAAPPAAVAAKFEADAGVLLSDCFQAATWNRQLAATRDLLLPRLVTGQLDIDDVDLGDLLPTDAA